MAAKKDTTPEINAATLRAKCDDAHSTALANILAKCSDAAGKGYITLALDPISDNLTTALLELGIRVNDQLVNSWHQVHLYW